MHVGRILDRILETIPIQKSSLRLSEISYFDSVYKPGIDVYDYLSNIHIYVECSESCYILAFIYIDRLIQNNSSFKLTIMNIHKLFIATLVISIKYLDDAYLNNTDYSKIGGITLTELNTLEMKVLEMLDYCLYIDQKTFYQYASELYKQWQQIEVEREKIRKINNIQDQCTYKQLLDSTQTFYDYLPSYSITN